MKHRYILEPYRGMNSRHLCPECKSRDRSFALYIDTDTGKTVHPTVGRCNHESGCGYHCTPKQYFQDNGIIIEQCYNYAAAREIRALHDNTFPETHQKQHAAAREMPAAKIEPSFIAPEIAASTFTGYKSNNFVSYLIGLFGEEISNQLISEYFIGTSKHWRGSTIFWQIDTHGKIRTGKIMLYDAATGKRVKEPFTFITWVHKVLKQPDFNLKQCLFGEHLLIDRSKPIAIVESEKTAIIASVYLPQFIWLAVGSLNNLSVDRCRVLTGRKVILFPDLNGFDKWQQKTKELADRMPGTRFKVSELLNQYATEAERISGLDLADYLIKTDWKHFRNKDMVES